MNFKDKVTELALQAGGSHYPNVNRVHLDAYTKLVINECIASLADTAKPHVATTFDNAQFISTLAYAEKAIKERFGL